MSGGKVVKEQHKTATHAKESSKNGKFKHKGQLKNKTQYYRHSERDDFQGNQAKIQRGKQKVIYFSVLKNFKK